ncbi:probable LRR receptor-like serine/threonine-protein kinase At3g47570 [Macadamia integrifolia]|uniref:probable LRR receptor-like serine/threonine-protein kinase At3g47570 n=1 Tax=Macadamia integrifolia TaxID=60698 RepID=UPI001C500D50|nr:probable LRR receptor-like serine/threonine-protein kinase At3g47570 [Macadamia integrifolia]
MKIIIYVVILAIVVISCFIDIFFWMRRTRKKAFAATSYNNWQLRLSFLELFRSTNGFSTDNLIVIGSFGSVYKAVLQESETVVSVKLFNLLQWGASKSFVAECETLKDVWHRNLVKILTACSSIDFEMNEFNALVYEFMPSGSLYE